MGRRISIVLATACALACAKRPPAIAVQPDDRQGEVGYRFLNEALPGSPTLPEDQELEIPRAMHELALPVYPQSALEARADPATVAVRIIIGTDGSIARVLDSPRLDSTPGPFASEFRRAVEDALRSWRFSPGQLQSFEDGGDVDGDGVSDYKRMLSSQLVEVYYDVAFDFRVVDGKGQVTPR